MTEDEKRQLIQYRINRAKETLDEVEFQIKNEKWNTAVNRLYYACYYAVIALLASKDISAKTHSGVRQMFALHFIRPGVITVELGDFYTDVFEMRHIGDYDDFIIFEGDKVAAMLEPAKKLIRQIELLIVVTK